MTLLNAAVGRYRPAFVGLGLAAVALALTMLAPADSLAVACGTEFDYYSDASYSQWVGAVAYTPSECGCSLYSLGTTTQYVRLGRAYCLPPPR